jgi:23S rRNA (guanosine2251-2'-O)-methyltransferase
MRKLKLEELNRMTTEEFKSSKKIPLIIILDDIRSALNVGSIFRTSDAFKIEKIIICGFTAIPPHKEITKSAIGATETVEWEYSKSTLNAVLALKKIGYTILGIEQTDSSIALSNYEPSKQAKFAAIFGNEVDGINNEVLSHLDLAIEIPQYGTKHSLNVSVCAGIVIHFLANKLIVLE